MALAYPVTLTPDDNGTVLVQFPDFPEAQTFGATPAKALARAVDALETVIDAYMRDRRPIPKPHDGVEANPGAVLPPMAAIKVELYRTMQAHRITKSALARQLDWHLPQVDRLLDVRHQSRLDQLDAAATVLGKRVSLSLLDVVPDGLTSRALTVRSAKRPRAIAPRVKAAPSKAAPRHADRSRSVGRR